MRYNFVCATGAIGTKIQPQIHEIEGRDFWPFVVESDVIEREATLSPKIATR